MPTEIAWTDETLNCIGGCNPVSIGCQRCAAARSAQRCLNLGNEKYRGLVKNGKWTGKIRTFEDVLDEPSSWRRPRKIFVNFMSDTFGPGVPFEFIDKIYNMMLSCERHTFQILTKHPDIAAKYYCDVEKTSAEMGEPMLIDNAENIWMGTSVEKQEYDWRIIELLKTPAAVHFLSLEPFMGAMDLNETSAGQVIGPCDECGKMHGNCDCCMGIPSIDQVIIGCESGPSGTLGRLGDFKTPKGWLAAAIDIVRQCKDAGVPVFVKQVPSFDGKLIKDIKKFPCSELQVQEFPESEAA